MYGGKELLLAHMSPAELVAYQYVLAVPAIALLALLRKERLWLPLRDMAAVWGSGLLGIALGQLLGAGLIVSSVLIPAKRSG